MAREMEETYYAHVSRYSTSALIRMKLGKILGRTVALHVFETRVDAQRFFARVRAGPE